MFRFCKDVSVNSFFPCTGRLWNSLPGECFALTYGLGVFKSRVNRDLLSLGSFWSAFQYDFIFCLLFFFSNFMPCNSFSPCCGVKPNYKKRNKENGCLSMKMYFR